MDGRLITFSPETMPFKRCLAFHASLACLEAIKFKWIVSDEIKVDDSAWSDISQDENNAVLNWIRYLKIEHTSFEDVSGAESIDE